MLLLVETRNPSSVGVLDKVASPVTVAERRVILVAGVVLN